MSKLVQTEYFFSFIFAKMDDIFLQKRTSQNFFYIYIYFFYKNAAARLATLSAIFHIRNIYFLRLALSVDVAVGPRIVYSTAPFF